MLDHEAGQVALQGVYLDLECLSVESGGEVVGLDVHKNGIEGLLRLLLFVDKCTLRLIEHVVAEGLREALVQRQRKRRGRPDSGHVDLATLAGVALPGVVARNGERDLSPNLGQWLVEAREDAGLRSDPVTVREIEDLA